MGTVIMPQLGETVTEGTVSKWVKKVGDKVAKYEPLLDVETDKVASEIPSPFAGVLTKILAEEGATVPVGAPVCEIESVAASPTATPKDVAAEHPDEGRAAARPPSDVVADRRSAPGDGVRHSPAVRKLAREHRVDLRSVTGTGKGGRITARDVAVFAQAGATGMAPAAHIIEAVTPPRAPAAPVPPPAHVPAPHVPSVSIPPPGPDDTIIRVTQIRKTIADRMLLSRTTIPYAWTMVEADLTDLVKWRGKQKEAFQKREGVNLTYLPMMIQAVCGALHEFPMVNGTWAGDHIIQRKHLNVGIAIDAEEGLIVPAIRDADRLSLAGLAVTIAELVEKARTRKLTLEDLSHGTITVNNTGALGSIASLPIINPPQTAIITMEAITKRPWVVNDAIAVRSIANLCLGFDHRTIDGGTAGRFLQSVKHRLEAPPASI